MLITYNTFNPYHPPVNRETLSFDATKIIARLTLAALATGLLARTLAQTVYGRAYTLAVPIGATLCATVFCYIKIISQGSAALDQAAVDLVYSEERIPEYVKRYIQSRPEAFQLLCSEHEKFTANKSKEFTLALWEFYCNCQGLPSTELYDQLHERTVDEDYSSMVLAALRADNEEILEDMEFEYWHLLESEETRNELTLDEFLDVCAVEDDLDLDEYGQVLWELCAKFDYIPEEKDKLLIANMEMQLQEPFPYSPILKFQSREWIDHLMENCEFNPVEYLKDKSHLLKTKEDFAAICSLALDCSGEFVDTWELIFKFDWITDDIYVLLGEEHHQQIDFHIKYAVQNGLSNVVDYLLENDCVEEKDSNFFWTTVADAKTAQVLHKQGIDPNTKDLDGLTPFESVCINPPLKNQFSQKEHIRALLLAGVRPEKKILETCKNLEIVAFVKSQLKGIDFWNQNDNLEEFINSVSPSDFEAIMDAKPTVIPFDKLWTLWRVITEGMFTIKKKNILEVTELLFKEADIETRFKAFQNAIKNHDGHLVHLILEKNYINAHELSDEQHFQCWVDLSGEDAYRISQSLQDNRFNLNVLHEGLTPLEYVASADNKKEYFDPFKKENHIQLLKQLSGNYDYL